MTTPLQKHLKLKAQKPYKNTLVDEVHIRLIAIEAKTPELPPAQWIQPKTPEAAYPPNIRVIYKTLIYRNTSGAPHMGEPTKSPGWTLVP